MAPLLFGSWETNYTGIGQHNIDYYTNDPGGPMTEVYRIQRE